MKKLIFSVCLVAAVALLPSLAHGSSIPFTIYCTGGNTCSTSNTGLTSYWTFDGGVTTGTSGGVQTFDLSFSVSETGEAAADLMSWSIQFGPSSGQVDSITSFTGPGPTPVEGKSNNGNNGCNSSVSVSICDDLASSPQLIPSSPGLVFDVQGTFTGSLGTDCGNSGGPADCLVVLSESNFVSSGQKAFAISQDVTAPVTAPEPASIALLGTGLFGAGMMRRRLKK